MPRNPTNLDWVRRLDPKNLPGNFGSLLYGCLRDLTENDQIIAQQGNFSLSGTPTPPPPPQSLTLVSHPQGVQFSIAHEGEFYQGIRYQIDYTAAGVTHTANVGDSRNGVLPVGNLTISSAQVRAMYPNSVSTAPVLFNGSVIGGGGSPALLPSQGAGTTRGGQPPGFGGPYRSQNGAPPVRTAK